MSKLRFLTLLITFTLVPSVALYAGGLTLRSLDLPDSFQIEPEYYTVTSIESSSEPGFLKFHVTSPHAEYEVEGLEPLRKLLHEIKIIEKIKKGEGGETGFVDGAVDSVKETGSGLVKLAAHPVDSVKGLGNASKKIGRKIGGVFRKKEAGEKGDGGLGGGLRGGAEREIAASLGVDVYTTNPYMQELVRRMATARMGGKGAVFIGKLLLPVSGIASIAMTAGGLNGAANQLVNDNDRPELFHLNKKALLEIGFLEGEIKKFLDNPYYSPRETTYLRFYLERLKAVDGFREIFERARDAASDWEADKVLWEAQVAADSLTEGVAYEKIRCFPEGMALKDARKIVFITPYDILDNSPLADAVVKRISGLSKEWSRSSSEIWGAGKIGGGFAASLLLKGIKARPWALFK